MNTTPQNMEESGMVTMGMFICPFQKQPLVQTLFLLASDVLSREI